MRIFLNSSLTGKLSLRRFCEPLGLDFDVLPSPRTPGYFRVHLRSKDGARTLDYGNGDSPVQAGTALVAHLAASGKLLLPGCNQAVSVPAGLYLGMTARNLLTSLAVLPEPNAADTDEDYDY